MNSVIEPSQAEIREEIALIRRAAKATAATPQSAAAFLKRIGADRWPQPQGSKKGGAAGKNRKK